MKSGENLCSTRKEGGERGRKVYRKILKGLEKVKTEHEIGKE